MAGHGKSLSRMAAQSCEEAKEPICRCRCRGKFHGASRGSVGDLPFGDPHSLEKKCSKCSGTGVFLLNARVVRPDVLTGVRSMCQKCQGTGILAPKSSADDLLL